MRLAHSDSSHKWGYETSATINTLTVISFIVYQLLLHLIVMKSLYMPYKRGSLIDILNKIQPASVFSFSGLNHYFSNLNMISHRELIQSRLCQIVSAI